MNASFALRSQSLLFPATTFYLTAGIFTLGRSAKCDLVVKHDTVSRRHAEIAVAPGSTTVRDLGSRNGTFLDDVAVSKAKVQVRQYVRFGNVAFMFARVGEGADEEESDFDTAAGDHRQSAPDRINKALSRAQRRVLDLLLEGLAEKKVAARLHLSATTVHNHVQAIYRILHVHSRSELLAQALRNGGKVA